MVAVPAIKRLMLGTLLLFAAIALAATYWAVAGPYGILQREDNPRLIEAIAQIRRGGIYDRKEQLLVKSVETTGGMRRSYLRPSTFSLVGYYSLRYGSSGAEAAFNQALNGIDSPDNFENYFVQDILNVPPKGEDINLQSRPMSRMLSFSPCKIIEAPPWSWTRRTVRFWPWRAYPVTTLTRSIRIGKTW